MMHSTRLVEGAGFHYTVRRFVKPFFSIALCLAFGAFAPAMQGCNPTSQRSRPSQELRAEQLEEDLKQLNQQAKATLDTLEEGPDKEEARRILAESERIMNEPRKLYFSSQLKTTPEMQAYHAWFIRKIEDCGLKHYPKRQGKSIYGKGLTAITLNKTGHVVAVEMQKSSGDRLLDEHIHKLVRASSPFGVLPNPMLIIQSRAFDELVIVIPFDYRNSDSSSGDPLVEEKSCRWES